MSTPFSFSWNDPASVRRALAQIVALADVCDQLSIAIAAAIAPASSTPGAAMRLTTASSLLTLSSEDLRDAAKQIGALLP